MKDRVAVITGHLAGSSGSSGPITKCLIANRGEIAIRIARACKILSIVPVGIHAAADSNSLHTRAVTASHELRQTDKSAGPQTAYLDIDQIVQIALETGCDAVHPGYGFLSESYEFAARCAEAKLRFVGPPASAIRLFGDKVQSRELAVSLGVPVVPGSSTAVTDAAAAIALVSSGAVPGLQYPVMLKASAGGGGRGIRAVHNPQQLEQAFGSGSREAEAAFGDGTMFVEKLVERPRHIEVQVLADQTGSCVHLWDRDCSVQSRNQKVVEMAPAIGLDADLRQCMLRDAVRLVQAAGYVNAGTVEYLVTDQECNPRIQVEHTVTEQVTGVDLVEAQFHVAMGHTLQQMALLTPPSLVGYAVQCRLVLTGPATDQAAGISGYREPSGPGVRVDSCGYEGYQPTPFFDPLLAKLICTGASMRSALARASFALAELWISGVPTNCATLQAIVSSPQLALGEVRTSFMDTELKLPVNTDSSTVVTLLEEASRRTGKATVHPPAVADVAAAPQGHAWVLCPLQGQVVTVELPVGAKVADTSTVAVLLSMKMEHPIMATTSGRIVEILVSPSDIVQAGEPVALLALLDESDEALDSEDSIQLRQPGEIRPDLAEVIKRQLLALDEARTEHDPSFKRRVARRRQVGLRTARENITDLVDDGTFVEYGRLRLAGQQGRRSDEDLILHTPADGIVTGIGCVNSELLFGGDRERTRTAVLSYDYTVLAGTQGAHSHHKTDRILEMVERLKIPVVWFCEGGGGRPGDTEGPGPMGAGLACRTFATFGKLSGLVPLVGLVSGFCFAGNAAMLGLCDVIIATKGANIGMGGPAMIEGGGLGVFKPTDIGPLSVQVPNGVVDLMVPDEATGVQVAKQYLSYFQGPLTPRAEHINYCADQMLLRDVIPENRKRIYSMKQVITLLADTDSVLFLREGFGIGIHTALMRVAGRAVGVIANNPEHLGGAIDGPAALKAARFLELCDAFDIAVLSLVDCPGFMVGPESESDATVRKFCRLFAVGASLSVPFFVVTTRKGYGLGAQAMAGGTMMGREGFCIAWPTGEFGGMGLEGAAKLGFSKQLADAKKDGGSKAEAALFEQILEAMYERGKALNNTVMGELDDTIDPSDTRSWLIMGLECQPAPSHRREHKKRPCISPW